MTNKKTIKALAKSGNLNKILQLKLRGYSNTSIAESMNTTSYKIVKQFKEALETYESLSRNSRWAVKKLCERAKNKKGEI